ncbi:MAG: hypothetical protein MJ229_01075 [bacterium]|nr:hypothetical protein [bacterium]
MYINSVSSVGFHTVNHGLKIKEHTSNPNFEGSYVINKKALKGISVAALLGMTTVMGCKQPTTPIYETPIEQEEDTQTIKEDETDEVVEETEETDDEIIPEETEIIEDENTEETTTDEKIEEVVVEDETEEKTDEVIEDITEEVIEETEETEEDITTQEVEEETPVVNVTRTEQAELFKDANVKAMFDLLGLNIKTKKSELVEGGYTPYSGDVLHMEFKISPSTKQVYDLILEESTPDKLVYKNSMVYIKSPSSQYSYKSTFMKDKNGDIIRKDSLDPAHYFKYQIQDDAIRIDTINSANDFVDYRDTIYYQKGQNSSEFINNYRGFLKFYTNASVTVEE